jgi:hypothetical protein
LTCSISTSTNLAFAIRNAGPARALRTGTIGSLWEECSSTKKTNRKFGGFTAIFHPDGVRTALHSSEIRSQREQFRWLRSLSEPDRCDFYESLYVLMRDAPLTGLACVVDRPGYNSRYLALYQQQPWLLCKTAFSIVVERAAKYARNLGRRLRVAPERCNSAEDDLLKSYYNSLKINGLPFAVESSEKYSPFTAEQFRETLYEFRLKGKSSPMAQLADLYLWPMCMGGYHESNQPYARLIRDGKLIECLLSSDAWPTLGTKYSCFDLVERKP